MKHLISKLRFWSVIFGSCIPLMVWGWYTDHKSFAWSMTVICICAVLQMSSVGRALKDASDDKPTIGRFIIIPDEAARKDDNMANVGLQLYCNPAEMTEHKVCLIEIDDRRGIKS